jgi:hypothetical protein
MNFPSLSGNENMTANEYLIHWFIAEHIVEIQLIGQFFEDATRGSLVSGNTPNFQRVDCGAFTSTRGNNIINSKTALKGVPAQPAGQSKSAVPIRRIMAALGNNKNQANFYLLQQEINGMKGRVSRAFIMIFIMAKLILLIRPDP